MGTETTDPLTLAVGDLDGVAQRALHLVYAECRTQHDAALLMRETPKVVSAALMRGYRSIAQALEDARRPRARPEPG